MQAHEQIIMMNGRSVHYWEAGPDNGRPIMLLHGGLADAAANWSRLIPLLADEFHVIAPDLPGFGESAPVMHMRVNDLNHWLLALLDRLDIEQVVLVGNSFGALAARSFAAAYPKRVPALVLADGGLMKPGASMLRLLLNIPLLGDFVLRMAARGATSPRTVARMFHKPETIPDNLYEQAQVNAAGFQALVQMIGRYPLPKKRIPPVNTLILWGDHDRINSLAESRRLEHDIPNAKKVEIVDCGHVPQIEAPDVMAWQIRQFLFEHSPIDIDEQQSTVLQ